MIEALFVNSSTAPPPKEHSRKAVFPPLKQEERVLDPKKSQNIAILLRALNVTREEVSEALLDGKHYDSVTCCYYFATIFLHSYIDAPLLNLLQFFHFVFYLIFIFHMKAQKE